MHVSRRETYVTVKGHEYVRHASTHTHIYIYACIHICIYIYVFHSLFTHVNTLIPLIPQSKRVSRRYACSNMSTINNIHIHIHVYRWIYIWARTESWHTCSTDLCDGEKSLVCAPWVYINMYIGIHICISLTVHAFEHAQSRDTHDAHVFTPELYVHTHTHISIIDCSHIWARTESWHTRHTHDTHVMSGKSAAWLMHHIPPAIWMSHRTHTHTLQTRATFK